MRDKTKNCPDCGGIVTLEYDADNLWCPYCSRKVPKGTLSEDSQFIAEGTFAVVDAILNAPPGTKFKIMED